jgi:serine/threonine-protein kinase
MATQHESREPSTRLKRALRAAFGSSRRRRPAGDSSLPPERVCTVEAEIARGGMGIVYRVRDAALRRTVALKLLREELTSEPSAVERFLEEARIAGALQHPGIVPIYALGRTETGRPYFTMKLIEGRTLASMLAARATPAHDQRRHLAILEAVCRTVEYAHDRGVVHLDLKPGNVMVGSFGEVQVVDWGLAVLANRPAPESSHPREQSGSVYGTPAYMPPEQARGESARIDTRADVFALGAMLCEILTGEPPYVGGREAKRRDAADARLEEAHARLRALEPRELGELCARCLASDADARGVTAAEIADAIAHSFSVLEERARAAEIAAAEAEARATHERRARRMTILLATTVLLSVLIGGTVWTWIARDRARERASVESSARSAIDDAARGLDRAESAADIELFGKAASAAERAQALVAGRDVDPELVRSAAELLERARTRESAARARLETARLDRVLLARVEDLRLANLEIQSADVDPLELERRYAEAFRGAGLDPDATPASEFAARAIERGIGVEVAAAFDDWIEVRTDACLLSGAQRMRELALLVDPDPARRAARALIAGGTPTEIERWVEAGDFARIQPATLIALTHSLGVRGLSRPDLLLRLYRGAQLVHPDDYAIAMYLAQTLFTGPREQHAEGEHFYRVAHVLRPDLAAPLVLLGWELEHRDIDYAAAADLDRRAIELAPQNGLAHYCLGRALRGLGDIDGALAAQRGAARLIGDTSGVHRELAALHRMKGEYAESVAELEPLAAHPDNVVARYDYERVLAEMGRLDDALAEMQRLIVDDPPGRARLETALASLLIERGEGDEATRVLRGSMDSELEAVLTLRELDARLADYLEIEPLIDRCSKELARDPEDAETHCRLGVLFEASGRFGEALVELRMGHALGSRQQGWSHPSSAWLEHAEQLVALERRMSSPSQPCEPRDAEEACEIATIAMTRGRWDSALQHFTLAFEREPSLENAGRRRLEATSAAMELARAAAGTEAVAPLDGSEASALRARSLSWMQAEITARREEIGRGDSLPRVLRSLAAWRAARELASVRDDDGLCELSPAESAAWRGAWSELVALAARARAARADQFK